MKYVLLQKSNQSGNRKTSAQTQLGLPCLCIEFYFIFFTTNLSKRVLDYVYYHSLLLLLAIIIIVAVSTSVVFREPAARSLYEFGFDVFEQSAPSSGNKSNVVISPISMFAVLSILTPGKTKRVLNQKWNKILRNNKTIHFKRHYRWTKFAAFKSRHRTNKMQQTVFYINIKFLPWFFMVTCS